MDANRRQVLYGLGVIGVSGLAGCSSDSDTSSPESEETPTATATGTETTTPTDEEADDEADSETDTQQRFTIGVTTGSENALALSADGTRALFGAPSSSDGVMYAYDRSSDGWNRIAEVVPDGLDDNASFGRAVALSDDGTTALVGAPDGNDNRGETYVLEREGDDWTRQAILQHTADTTPLETNGWSVSLSADGTTALVGIPKYSLPDDSDDDVGLEAAGAAFVYTADSDWSRAARLLALDGNDNDRFGHDVSLSGDGTTAVVGAPQDDGPSGSPRGGVYVFDRDGGGWSQEKVVPDDSDANDHVGWAVSVSGDGETFLAGAFQDEDPNGPSAGSAYVFGRSGDGWEREAKLATDTAVTAASFGVSLSLSADGTTAIVGAPQDEAGGNHRGAAYLYDRDGGEWTQRRKYSAVPPEAESSDLLGDAVALSDDGTTAAASGSLGRGASVSGRVVHVFEGL